MIKKILLLLSTVIFFNLTGCENEDVLHSPEQPQGINSISGEVQSWNESADRVLLFGFGENEIFGATKISRKGTFQLNLSDPDENLLTPLNLFPAGGVSTHTLIFSREDVKAIVGSFYVYQTGVMLPVGQIYRHSSSLPGEISSVGPWFSVQYIFVNESVSISGKEVCLYNFEEGVFFSITQKVNLELVKGWNKIIYRSIEEDTQSSTIEVSNVEPSGGNWYYDAL
ncbi:MAG: hypothetical protein SCALA702_25290 [Melioribacteraceae bacterium]|nr:MAG: hypothetical protein SCALA702_25290 [Melioribacteraceae bacterium]